MHSEWLAKRGLTQEYLETTYGALFGVSSIRVPVTSPGGRLAFWITRDFSGSGSRYMTRPEGARKGATLWGYQQAVPVALAEGYWVLTEGFSDAAALMRQGIPAVAALGTRVSLTQRALLAVWPVPVVWWLDGDAGGKKALERAEPTWATFMVEGLDPAEVVGQLLTRAPSGPGPILRDQLLRRAMSVHNRPD